MITVTRELYPHDQDQSTNVRHCANSAYPIYVSASGRDMLEIRRSPDHHQTWRSRDNGASWSLVDEIPMNAAGPNGLFAEVMLGPLYRDPDNGRIIRFQQQWLFTVPSEQRRTYEELARTRLDNSCQVFYQISSDAGETWGPMQQLMEQGSGFDERHWAQHITFRQGSAVLGAPPPFTKRVDGAMVFPCAIRTPDDQERFGSIQAGRFLGRWTGDADDITWGSGGRVPGGGCEQAVAMLKDGRMLNIMRLQGQVDPYPFDLWLRPYALSEDGGETWCEPRPLEFDDGTGLTSPRSWSVLIRSEKNGRLYWIANILPGLGTDASVDIQQQFPMRADPRYPLAIVEVDEENLRLKRDTLTIIQDREPQMPRWVRFSNYHVYDDRETGELVLLVLTSYCELQEGQDDLPWPSYRYRIRVDG